MSYIAKTNGGTEVLEIRSGVLADIPESDRSNWRSVIDAPPPVDRLYQSRLPTDILVVGDEVHFQYSVISSPDALRKARLKEYAASKRWDKTQAGVTLPSGVKIKTDEASKTKIDQALAMLEKGWVAEIRWKVGTGEYLTLDLATMTGIAQAVAAYEQACFAAEEQIVLGIDAGTIATTAQIDGYAWP